MESFLYFAYGSNLLKQRLRLNNPSAIYKGIAKLKGYRFQFNYIHNAPEDGGRWKGSAANIVLDPQSYVWGTVWELQEADKASLDEQEKWYNGIEVEVTIEGGSQLCRTYQMKEPYKPADVSLPSPQYKDVILRGARQSNLPANYIEFLETLPDNGNTCPVDLYEDILKLIENSNSSKT